jgi:hypothetical protein
VLAYIAEMNRFCLILFDMKIRMFGPCVCPAIPEADSPQAACLSVRQRGPPIRGVYPTACTVNRHADRRPPLLGEWGGRTAQRSIPGQRVGADETRGPARAELQSVLCALSA